MKLVYVPTIPSLRDKYLERSWYGPCKDRSRNVWWVDVPEILDLIRSKATDAANPQ